MLSRKQKSIEQEVILIGRGGGGEDAVDTQIFGF